MPEATLREIERKKRFFSPVIIFSLCAILTFLAWLVAYSSSQTENIARFDRSTSSLLYSFKNRMAIYTNALVYTRNLMDLKPNLTHDEFKKFVSGMNLETEYPGIRTIGYIKRVDTATLRKDLAQLPPVAKDLLKNPKDYYDVVYYTEAIVNTAGNARGMDLSVNAERSLAMRDAARLGVPVSTTVVKPITSPDHTKGLQSHVVFVPHYKAGMPLDTEEQRTAALAGFVYGGFLTDALFGNIAGDAKMQTPKLILQVYDGTELNEKSLVFSQGNLSDAANDFVRKITLKAMEHEWTIILGAREDFAPAYSRFIPYLVLLIGSILSLALTQSARSANRYAKKLQEDITIRKQAEAQLSEEKQIVELTSKIGTTLKAEQDLSSIVQMVTDVGTKLTGAQFGAFFYNSIDSSGEALTLFSLSGADKEAFAKFCTPRNMEVFKDSFEGRGITRVDDITKDPRYGKMAPHYGMPHGHLPVKSYLSAPVISKNGNVLGSLLFGHPEADVFAPRTESTIKALAIQAASAMDNANLYRDLSTATQAADAASKAKSLFLANVSHEIRTPLGLMLGFAELTAEHKNEPKIVEENIEKILRSGRELTRILGEVLDLSKVEANALVIDENTIVIDEFLENLQIEWRRLASNKHLNFELIKSGNYPKQIYTDSTRLTQIIVNLLSNALKFTDKGFVRIIASSETLNSKDFFTLQIEDSGIGIAEDHKSYLFQTFSQGDSSISRKYGGSGLGLALSKQLAKALGGTLELSRSEIGKGSSFTLCLPVKLGEEKVTLTHPKANIASTTLDNIKVLVVDDSVDNQILISTFLTKAKATVETANNGEECVKMALSNEYNIVLMDIQMPILDGYVAFERLKDAGYNRPIIALTANALTEEKQKAKKLGFYGYLTKPVNRQVLVSTIAEAVRI